MDFPQSSEERLKLSRAQLLAYARDLRTLYEQERARRRELEEAYMATLEALINALDVRDTETEGHSRRVAAYTVAIAKTMGLKGEELTNIERGALLHDIGKIGVPDAILRKRGPLTPEEWRIMRMHPVMGRQILRGVRFLKPAIPIVYSHHERWDGTGYPEGLVGEAISLSARIFAVADAFDALTSDRPYRRAVPAEVALREIRRCTGTHFDPQVVEAFLQAYEEIRLIKEREFAQTLHRA